MLNFTDLTQETFLNEYWQKKPLLIKNALPNFESQLSGDEIAGLAMDEELDSKLVIENPNSKTDWQIKKGPLAASDFQSLPKSHWTCLVHGIDRVIPPISQLFDHFNFIPHWRIDDIMISVSGLHGNVGPHYDNYDVFLFQAEGKKKWSLTTKDCHAKNHIPDIDLRIMSNFEIEQEFILEEGDMLYLPAHVGHHGVSLSELCMTYSFGYRSYQLQELWDSLGDFLSENAAGQALYQDPNWQSLINSAEITHAPVAQAKALLQSVLENETVLQQWFGRFATQLDASANQLHMLPLEDKIADLQKQLINHIKQGATFHRDLNARVAFSKIGQQINLFINGERIVIRDEDEKFIELLAFERTLSSETLRPFLKNAANQALLLSLYQQQILQVED